ncbi:Septin spn6 [Grifola frondosa]|uniref:Septin spn6 n=1 Tax=Grifola frondosa TaxID=5627 RepID=A0A1C7M402_GRIFR|nr:Septin spn6 [Grifola frondosa]
MLDGEPTGYTLMVAGRRTGKTSFLRLLLDTSNVAPTVTRDQLASVAKFVQGCSGHTTHVRTVDVDVDLAPDHSDKQHLLTLTLIDTPSLEYEDDTSSQRTVSEILRHVDTRFAESVDDPNKALSGDHHVHLCIYFLDPDYIVPPSVSAPPAPVVPRARTNSLSTHESEPVILEPPVTTNPLLCRPTLPASDIAIIRRLSSRVNVLPVIACADTLTNDRLTAVKLAIRRDLADAGIGFGIFDLDIPQYALYNKNSGEMSNPMVKPDPGNTYTKHTNGSSSVLHLRRPLLSRHLSYDFLLP